ncbi:MAG: hypothetical protein ONB44_12955 [candidate division KSB1 bacterium]|nr:hypothetical protein [candidate division KSB1 bacterium]MDZ7303029.1 hypothetical protein [candidate division KSB1 bacterium]MDZ7312463.1 hypothetical protein [candidate division KSB1 bacterium]
MSKHKKHIMPGSKEPFPGAPGKSFSAQSESPAQENRRTGDDGKIPAKKVISGVWVLVVMVGLLILLVVQHWLRQ